MAGTTRPTLDPKGEFTLAKKSATVTTVPANVETDHSTIMLEMLTEFRRVLLAVNDGLKLGVEIGAVTGGGASPFQASTIDTGNQFIKHTPNAWTLSDGSHVAEYHLVAELCKQEPRSLCAWSAISLLSDLYYRENGKPLFTRQNRYLSAEHAKFVGKYGFVMVNLGTDNGFANLASISEYDSRGIPVRQVIDAIAKKVDSQTFQRGSRTIFAPKTRPQGATRSKFTCKCGVNVWCSIELQATCDKCHTKFVKQAKMPAGKRQSKPTGTTASEASKRDAR